MTKLTMMGSSMWIVRAFLGGVAVLAATLAGFGSVQAAQSQASLCSARGYTVGFFNGVWNDDSPDGAISGMNALKEAIGTTHEGEMIEYELFYNHTGSTVGATGAQDLAEVFMQRALELDSSGELGRRFEYFWEAAGNSERSFLDRVVGAIGGELAIADGLYSSLATKAVAGWSHMLSNPPTQVNYAQHRAQLDTLKTEGQKLVLIGHSQGNLFVNPAYDYILPKIGSKGVATVHIAPASVTVRGAHVLASIDLVINGLRLQGLGSVPSVNLHILPSARDFSGHKLVETYLDGRRDGRERTVGLARAALGSLSVPTGEIGSRGFFTVTLTWDGEGDVDLHAFEPGGRHVYYSAMNGNYGELDIDNIVANGPEHYYASCDPAVLATGDYTIGINNYARATGRTATLQVAFAQGGQPLTRTMVVGAVRGTSGDASPLPALVVSVSKDAAGKFTAKAR